MTTNLRLPDFGAAAAGLGATFVSGASTSGADGALRAAGSSGEARVCSSGTACGIARPSASGSVRMMRAAWSLAAAITASLATRPQLYSSGRQIETSPPLYELPLTERFGQDISLRVKLK